MRPLPQLDPSAPLPLYRQLYEYFRGAIKSGDMPAGFRLPATRELAGLLGLNRTTVSSAYDLLVSEGLISGQVGRGSFVAGEPGPSGAGRTERLDWDLLLGPSSEPAASPQAPLGEMVSFASSRPSAGLFPMEAVRRVCEEVLTGPRAASILQLGSPGGYEPLRQFLLEEARRSGDASPSDDLMITSGCQQAFDLLQRALVPPGETVVMEDPVYPGLKNLFRLAGANLAGAPVGPDGISLEHLRHAIEKTRPRMLIVTPNFQNPTGATLPLPARHAVLDLAARSGVVLVENDIYGDLRYTGEPLPTLKRMGGSPDTVLLRSFSKVAFPGLRVGWAIGPAALIARLREIKQVTDLHTDQLSQAVMLRFAESGRLAEHTARMRAAGTERLAATLAGCRDGLPVGTRFTRPEGGMNLWVRLPEPLDAGDLLPKVQRERVTYLPGSYFTVSRHEPGGLRLSFAGLEPEKIRKGIAVLGEVVRNELLGRPASRSFEPAPAMV